MEAVTALPVFFALIGLVLGSFGNVLILRIRSGETIGGRSHCPHCRKNLAWFDLIPLASFVVLGGRCRRCAKPISIQYPFVECGVMLLFLLGWILSPADPVQALLLSLALYFLFLACVYDGLYQQIPDAFTALFAAVVLTEALFFGKNIFSHLLAASIPFAWFGIQWLVSRGKAVGTGDIFLGAAIGFWLGVHQAITMLLLSYMIGAIVVLLFLVTKKFTFKRERISFGPFMGAATVLTLLGVGDAYISLLR